MSVRIYTLVSGVIFLLIAVLQLVRVALQWDVAVEGYHVPLWGSVVAVVVAGFLSFVGFRLFQAQQVSLFR